MNLSRITRLLEVIGLLQSGLGHNTNSLARECEVSRRTVFRDLEVLRLAGVPLKYDELEQIYSIPGAHFLPPTNFTPEEALSLLVLCYELGDKTGVPFHGPARTAALKLEANLPPRLQQHVRDVTTAVRIRLEPNNPLTGHEPVFQQLLAAISRRKCVRIHYHSLTERKDIQTRLSPYRMLFSRRSWYVVGRSSLHRAVRTFHVGRILHLELLEDSFDFPRGFSIQRYLRNAWHLIPEPGPDKVVVIRFEKMVAENVAEVSWHKTQRVRFLKDGRLEYRVTVSGLNEISWWILGYGDQAEVIRPAALRRLVAGRSRRLLERYPETRPTSAPSLNGAPRRGTAAGRATRITKRGTRGAPRRT